MFNAWGNYVKDYIEKVLHEKGINVDEFLKVPCKPRVKEVASIVAKAFFRNKEYKDPLSEITDKVGIRFIVLLERDVEVISKIIEDSDEWNSSLDRDYQVETLQRPELFTYKSNHFVVYSNKTIEIEGVLVDENTPCEIQIRTLEQHAYAEISHDVVYKKSTKIDPMVKRLLARSMAYSEGCDDLFGKVYSMIEKDKELYNSFTNYFLELYNFDKMNTKLNKAIYEVIEPIILKYKITVDDIKKFIQTKSFILRQIDEKKDFNILYSQSIVILIYFLVKFYGDELEEIWDFTDDLLAPIYCDLGISFSSI